MNSEGLRKIAQNKNEIFAKDNELEDLQNTISPYISEFVDKNHNVFLDYLDAQINQAALAGNLTHTIYRTEYEDQKIISFGKISAPKYIWEDFFRTKNNPYLNDWAGKNKIFLTVKKKRNHNFDIPLQLIPKQNANNVKEYEWSILIDIRKHSTLYRKLRSIFHGNAYYHYILKHSSKENYS